MTYQPCFEEIPVANHSNLGKEFEQDLISTHAVYETLKLAKVDKHPVEWVYIGFDEYCKLAHNPDTKPIVAKTAAGRFIKMKDSNVDFSGVARSKIFRYGFQIKFDAKMSAGDFIKLGNFRSHQVDNLVQSARCGAIAGFMINLYDLRRVFFCPAEFVRLKLDKNYGKTRAAAGDGRITLGELKQKATEIPYSARNVDWHSVLLPG